mmetsp:Transcript_50879/g.122652  ORF Transcript_50879/g.122652 Transcript_50879/m.122652 type:complete len:588 (-) Transcript_50879:114-1877(-)
MSTKRGSKRSYDDESDDTEARLNSPLKYQRVEGAVRSSGTTKQPAKNCCGQRKPYGVSRTECAIFIPNLPPGILMEELTDALKHFVASQKRTRGFGRKDVGIRFCKSDGGGTKRGTVEFDSPEFRDLALGMKRLRGEEIKVYPFHDMRSNNTQSPDQNATAIKVGNLPPAVTEKRLSSFLAQRIASAYLLEPKIEHCLVASDKSHAYVQFESYLDAYAALNLNTKILSDHSLAITIWQHSKSSKEMKRRVEGRRRSDHESEFELCTGKDDVDNEPAGPTVEKHIDAIDPSVVGQSNPSTTKTVSCVRFQTNQVEVVSPRSVLNRQESFTSFEDSATRHEENYHGQHEEDHEYSRWRQERERVGHIYHHQNQQPAKNDKYAEVCHKYKSLKAKYASLLKDKEELESRSGSLTKERDEAKAIKEAAALEIEQLKWRLDARDQTNKQLAADKNELNSCHEAVLGSMKKQHQSELDKMQKELSDSAATISDLESRLTTTSQSALSNEPEKSKIATYEAKIKELEAALQQQRQDSMEEKRELRQDKLDLREEKQELKEKLKNETKHRLELEKELAEKSQASSQQVEVEADSN